MPTISLRGKKQFQQKLLDWYARHARDLPWRRTHNPYHILVSEMMLQQTQVDRVIPKYEAWLAAFPTVYELSAASKRDVLALWQGLGYNRRALYLQRIADIVVNELDGEFPREREKLLELPGIGPYTAGAIMSFAYKADAEILDTNVKRVVGRLFAGFRKLRELSDAPLWDASRRLLPRGDKTYFFNQALMDFGAMVCTARKPACGECPFAKQCASYPDILDAKPAELRVGPKTKETLYYGQPRRIWRGRILKFLHEAPTASAGQIGTAIQHDYSPSRKQWLEDVLQTMIKDGMVEKSGLVYHLPKEKESK